MYIKKLKIQELKMTEQGKMVNSTITYGDFNTSLSIMDKTSRQKIKKEIKYLYNIINQLDLTDI